jgi:hypothetical protein
MGKRLHLGLHRYCGDCVGQLLHCEVSTVKDETIRPGDLVMVVRGAECCGKSDKLGSTYTVLRIEPRDYGQECNFCDSLLGDAQLAIGYTRNTGFALSRLKKIHPPELPETVDAAQEVEA